MSNDFPPMNARLGTGEVARIIGSTREWVSKQCLRGEFPCTYAAGRYRFTTDDVAEILVRTRRKPRPRIEPARLEFRELPEDARRVVVKHRSAAIDWRSYARKVRGNG